VYILATKSFDDLEIVLSRPQSGLDDNFSLGSSKYDFASLIYKYLLKSSLLWHDILFLLLSGDPILD
jgi:hypothetical protein